MDIIDASFGYPLEIEEKDSKPPAVGIVNKGFQCGMLWGAVLAIGAQARRQYIDDEILPGGFTVGRVSSFESRSTLGQLQGVHPGDGHLGQHSREEQRL